MNWIQVGASPVGNSFRKGGSGLSGSRLIFWPITVYPPCRPSTLSIRKPPAYPGVTSLLSRSHLAKLEHEHNQTRSRSMTLLASRIRLESKPRYQHRQVAQQSCRLP